MVTEVDSPADQAQAALVEIFSAWGSRYLENKPYPEGVSIETLWENYRVGYTPMGLLEPLQREAILTSSTSALKLKEGLLNSPQRKFLDVYTKKTKKEIKTSIPYSFEQYRLLKDSSLYESRRLLAFTPVAMLYYIIQIHLNGTNLPPADSLRDFILDPNNWQEVITDQPTARLSDIIRVQSLWLPDYAIPKVIEKSPDVSPEKKSIAGPLEDTDPFRFEDDLQDMEEELIHARDLAWEEKRFRRLRGNPHSKRDF